MNENDLPAKPADVKEDLYRTTLGLTVLTELLADKGYFTREFICQRQRN